MSADLQDNKIDNLTKNLDKLEKAVTNGFTKTDEAFTKVYDKLDIMEAHFIRKDAFEKELEYLKTETNMQIKNLEAQVNSLKKVNWWIVTTVGTILIGAVIGSVLIQV